MSKKKSKIDKLVKELRTKANSLTADERAELLREGLQIIYTKKTPRVVEFQIAGWSLAEVWQELNRLGVSPESYHLLSFECDYSNCYYEGDEPTIKITGKIFE